MTARFKKQHRDSLPEIFEGLQQYLDALYGGNVRVSWAVQPNGWWATARAGARNPDAPGAKRVGSTMRRSHSVDWVVWGEIAAWLLAHGLTDVRSGAPGRKSYQYKTLNDLYNVGAGVAMETYALDPYTGVATVWEGLLPVLPEHQAESPGEALEVLAPAIDRVLEAANAPV